ncbi:protein translocase subunit SecF [Xanthobacter sp. TB0139]|uniref:protein translocase subunit SecF n=1 Tax=Xanthobacter sp. TB0139 TaxID=3459178 RepID=UPI004039448F
MPLIDYIPAHTNIRFMKLRFFSFPASAILSVVAVVLFMTVGFNLGIDFRGGTMIEAQSTHDVADVASLREHLTDLDIGDVQIQEFGSPRDVLIRVGQVGASEESQQAIVQLVREVLGDQYSIRRVETVGPSVSGELVRQSLLAMVLGTVAILAYLWFRFEWQFAVGAIVTTLHDVFAALMVYSILGLDFDLTAIAALLTIMGYSLNDTVVVYDRIREMLRRYKKMPMPELLDLAVNATFSRTIIVSLTTFFATLALYLFGGEVLRGFSLAMMIGVIIGTYSSIFVAAPILIHLGLRRSTVAGKAKPEEGPEDILGVDEAARFIEAEERKEGASRPVSAPQNNAGRQKGRGKGGAQQGAPKPSSGGA